MSDEHPKSQPSPASASAFGPTPLFTEQLPSQPGMVSGMASAFAPFVFFDEVSAGMIYEGTARLTLKAARHIASAPDGTVLGDWVVVSHLRTSTEGLIRLRNLINDLLLHAATPEDLAN